LNKKSGKAIYSFENSSDYLFDVRWCPTHPAVFATADGSGVVDVWNLNEETEVPILKTQIVTGKALSKLRWSQDGKKLLVADSHGYLHHYDTGEISVPRSDEWVRFEDTLIKLQSQRDEPTTTEANAQPTPSI